MPSDIQVFVRFKEQSVFAGEEIRTTITFKNVASISDNLVSETKNWHVKGRAASGNAVEPSQPRGSGGVSSRNPRLAALNNHGARKTSKGSHRATTSLSTPFTGSSVSRSASWTASPVTHQRPSHTHQRSVSIISLGSPDVRNEETQTASLSPISRPRLNHGRSVSHQVHPRRSDGNHDPPFPSSETAELPVHVRKASAFPQYLQSRGRGVHADAQLDSPAKSAGNSDDGNRRVSPSPQDYTSPRSFEEQHATTSSIPRSPHGSDVLLDEEYHRTHGRSGLESGSGLGLATKILPGTSVTDSNRSSREFQSLSNQSQDTLGSELASAVAGRPMFPTPTMRQQDGMRSMSKPRGISETLLMGYAHVSATFTLDGALVDQAPFQEVKRRGFLGGQAGGGVVGVKPPSNGGGLLGGLSLTSIGESIGGLLGGRELSSLKEMKDVASSRAIPLLSTPQSLLFVDLTLGPGEERSYSFRYTIPKGLPASYKGKAIKIVYDLTIGVQGAPDEKAVQKIRCVNIPFKVFSGVNGDGEVLGHDLMQPYVILHDTAHVKAVGSASSFPERAADVPAKNKEASTQDFLTYVDTLLNKRRRRQSSSATLEPPSGLVRKDGGSRAKQAIERAVFMSRQNPSSHQSLNRFDIARNGQRIATVTLDRTLHRLGESVTASVDLSNAQMPCYSLRCSLETTEKVNPALARRSAASITRLSRRVYHSQSENTLFTERIAFSPWIPITASPTLLTSGVNLDWALRLEFVTTRVEDSVDQDEQPAGKYLVEEVARDDRGTVLAAVETLQCETFEVSIPITVYGDTDVAGMDAEEITGIPI